MKNHSFILFVLILFYSSEMFSQIKPLKEILMDNINDERYIASYSSKRCSATFLEVASIFKNDNPSLSKILIDKSSELALAAAIVDQRKSVETIEIEDVLNTQNEITEIRKVLTKISTKSYAETGSYISAHFEDLKLCREMYPIEEKIF